MRDRTLHVALISGGMYDRLYERLPEFERATGVTVRVGFRGPHPELNAHLAVLDPVPYHLVSTHSKYAPSQSRFLAPLEGFDTADFFPALLELASIDGALYGLPRNIDVRLLHYRTDLVDRPPAAWDELAALARAVARPPRHYGFVFPGKESGLFGTFYELAESAGARLFPGSGVPELDNYGGRWALGVLRELYAGGAVPPAVAGWHYDEVHRAFRDGRAAMVADWPGYYGSYLEPDSAVRGRFRLSRLPAGPRGRVCAYAGSHTFALTRAGTDHEPARELLRFLTAPAQQELEARQGAVPVRHSIMEQQHREAAGADAERLQLLARSIESDLIIPPKLSDYPAMEEILWRTVRSAMVGEMPVEEALAQMETRIARSVSHAAAR